MKSCPNSYSKVVHIYGENTGHLFCRTHKSIRFTSIIYLLEMTESGLVFLFLLSKKKNRFLRTNVGLGFMTSVRKLMWVPRLHLLRSTAFKSAKDGSRRLRTDVSGQWKRLFTAEPVNY